jgi:hypothetical protein
MWKYVTSFSIFSAGLETLHDYVKDCGHLAPHLTIFQFLVYHGCQFHCWRKLDNPETTSDLPIVTEFFFTTMLYQVHLSMCRNQTNKL